MEKKRKSSLDTFKILFESEATPENIYQELTKKTPDPAERLSLFNEIRTYFEAFKPIETLSLNDPPIYVADVMTYLSNQIALEGYHLPDDIKHGEYLWYNDSDVLKYKRIKTLKTLVRLIDATTVEPTPKRQVPEPSTLRSAESLFANERFNQVLRLARGNKPDFDKFIKFYVEKRFENTSSTIKDIIDTYPYKLPTDNAVRAWINGKGTKKTNGAKGFLNHFKEVFKENLEDFF